MVEHWNFNAQYINYQMASVHLMGGLGNWMFQIAFVEYLTNISGSQVFVDDQVEIAWQHSSNNYMKSVFQKWNHLLKPKGDVETFWENNLHPANWTELLSRNNPTHFWGYFQHHEYILQSFLDKIQLPTSSLERNPDIPNSVFVHIRGGDYVNNWLLHVNFKEYYSHAIQQFPEGTHFSIFTNDESYAKSFEFLKTISHSFVCESEIDSLYLMSQCKGGICANSSFSWWGAYLNRNRKLILPSKWFNDPSFYTAGFYFPEATIVDV